MLKQYFDRYTLPRDLFAALMDDSTALIFAKDSRFRYLYLNPAAARAAGKPVEEILGQDDFSIFPPDHARKIRESDLALLAGGQPITIREAISLNGRTGHLRTTKSAVYDADGIIIGLIGISHDITDLHEAEMEQRETAARERALRAEIAAMMESIPAAVLVGHDPLCRSMTGNQAAHELLKVPRGESLLTSASGDKTRQHFQFCSGGRTLPFEEWPAQRAAASGQAVRDCEMDLVFTSGEKRTLVGAALPLFDDRSRSRGAVCVLVDVTSYKQVQQQLQQANKSKENFFGILGHELRNPLSALSNCVVLMTETKDAETRVTMLQVMERQVAQLKRLTSDLLDVNRIANGKLAIERARIDLGEVLYAAVETSRAVIEKCGQELIVRYTYSPIIVDGDFDRLMQLVTNLLNNAAKFSPVGGQILLSMERAGPDAIVRVKDGGIGIDQHMLDKIFQPYTQVDEPDSRAQAGLGLGLALVKYIAELHGGTVHARSDGLNKGAEFVVRLPVAGDQSGGAADENR
jgi:PAS domain S-box-containing protein